MGTQAGPNDEWIELYNATDVTIDLSGWTLQWRDQRVQLGGQIAPRGFFLLERTDDATVSDVAADLIYIGGLRNGGEALKLLDAAGRLVDSANGDGGAWPGGHNGSKGSMQRLDVMQPDTDENWQTFVGTSSGHDAAGNLIRGSPRAETDGLQGTPPTLKPEPLEASRSDQDRDFSFRAIYFIGIALGVGVVGYLVVKILR